MAHTRTTEEPPVNLSLAPPLEPAQLSAAAALAALSTVDCLVDAGPVPSLSTVACAADDCPAVGTCHLTWEDATAVVAPWREGDWCPAHAEAQVHEARECTRYIDVEVRSGCDGRGGGRGMSGAEQLTVYAWCNAGNGTDMQTWIAIAEDGEVLAQHMSSSRAWGQHDVGPDGFYRQRYADKFGERFMDRLDYVVVPDRQTPPHAVYERNQARAAGGAR
jgi:hypothetical protein